MNPAEIIALVACALAALPALLFLSNLPFYRPLPRHRASHPPRAAAGEAAQGPPISVLIPARNEAANIGPALESVLANRDVNLEVVVLDDGSTDGTRDVVAEFARRDGRVRLETAPPLPAGWCGKQHACHVLALRARHPLLLFIDADVRLAPDAVGRMTQYLASTGVSLASGVPRQITGSWSERVLLPLIHFVLLGYLPMPLMRWTRWPAFSAGCGQIFLARAEAYHEVGGHAEIRDTLHDGIRLPRLFRSRGHPTGLFDATDAASCRMYHGARETWRGLGKNATEGLGAPGVIGPMTFLLAGGQLLPWALLAASPGLEPAVLHWTLLALFFSYLPRVVGALLFKQDWRGVGYHPVGTLLLLVIQWQARLRQRAGRAAEWKGRRYAPVARHAIVLALALGCHGSTWADPASAPGPAQAPARIALTDQYARPLELTFPRTNTVVLTIADQAGASLVDGWIAALKKDYSGRVEFWGLAHGGGAPPFLQGRIRRKFQESRRYPVMLDWTGQFCSALGYVPKTVTVLVLNGAGQILHRATGAVSDSARRALGDSLERALGSAKSTNFSETARAGASTSAAARPAQGNLKSGTAFGSNP